MKNKTFARMICGIFCVMLISLTFAMEGATPVDNQWRPVQSHQAPQSNWSDYSQLQRETLQAQPWAQVNYPRHRERPYRFRPWEGQSGQRSAIPAYTAPRPFFSAYNTRQPVTQPPVAADQYGVDSRYRFRPMELKDGQRDVPLRWTYRPAQIEIPNHYVYRPLKVKEARSSVYQQWQQVPASSYSASYRYMNNYDPYQMTWSSFRHRGYWADVGYPVPRFSAVPRYTGNMPFDRYRFRPLNRPGSLSYGYRGREARYAALPYPLPPNYPQMLPRRPYPMGNWDWPPSPYFGMEQAMWRPVMPNRYGVNWYDGQADGEGAWYQLAGQQAWPRISYDVAVE